MTDLALDPVDPPDVSPDIWQAARDIYLAGQPGRVVCAALGLKESTFWRRAALGGWLRRDGDAPAPPPLDLTAPPDTTEGALDKAWRRVCAAVDAGLSAEALRWMRVHAALKAQHSDGFLTAMRDRRDQIAAMSDALTRGTARGLADLAAVQDARREKGESLSPDSHPDLLDPAAPGLSRAERRRRERYRARHGRAAAPP